MKNNMMKRSIGFLIILTAVSFTGCDMMESVKQYFNKDKNTPEAVAKTSAALPAPVSQEASAAKPAEKLPLKSNEIARVGGWVLTAEEFDEKLAALKELVPDYDTQDLESRRLVVDELVNQQLIIMNAEKTGTAKKEEIVNAVEEFRKTLIVRDIASKLTENITTTEEEAKAFYEANKEVLKEPAQYKVREIVVESQLKANELLIDVLKKENEKMPEGISFEDAAKQFSINPSAQNGGDLGFLMDVPFQEMAAPLLGLDVGEISSVFKGPNGYYIIKLEEKKGGEAIPFEDIKQQIIDNQTIVKQQQAVLDYINKLRESANIEINENYFK